MAVTTVDDEPITDERPPFDWRVLVACVALGLVGLGLGLFVGRDDHPGPRSVDVRFLQDMRYHHEQAVGMSLVLLAKPAAGANPTLRQLAREIVQSQAFEGGRMAQMLAGFGVPTANEGTTAMEWMSMPVPIDEMPGMATTDDTAELDAAQGAAADRVFVRLMTAHHTGGIHMAEDAFARVSSPTVRAFAEGLVDGQRKEIAELAALAAKL